MRPFLPAVLAFALLPACGELFAFEDTGDLCVVGTPLAYPDPDNEEGPMVTTYEADASVTVRVVFEECAGGCAEDIETECDVITDGDTLVVSGSASYREPGGNRNCPAVCVAVTAECDSDPLPAGSYSVLFGEQSTSFDVPDTREPAVIGHPLCE